MEQQARDAIQQCATDLIEAWNRGAANVIIRLAIESIEIDALARVQSVKPLPSALMPIVSHLRLIVETTASDCPIVVIDRHIQQLVILVKTL